MGVEICNVFEGILLFLARQKYGRNSNIVKYYCNLK